MKLEEAVKQVKSTACDNLESYRQSMNAKYPNVLKAMQNIDNSYTQPKRRKGFNLIIRESKRHGRRIYGRLSHNGKILPTKFNTNTGSEIEAEQYLIKNKEILIEKYLARKDGRMYAFLTNFYTTEKQKGLSEKNIKIYDSAIKNKFIPFLRQEKIKEISQITKYTLRKFLNALEKTGIKTEEKAGVPLRPQSANKHLLAVKRIFNYLELNEMVKDNPCDGVKGLRVTKADKIPRGCYVLDQLKGVFNRVWKDRTSFLLNLIIYTTGMRNSEIKRLKMADFELKGGCWYANINRSKTESGERLLPVHNKVYGYLKKWAETNKVDNQKNLFEISNNRFKIANEELARRLKACKSIKQKNITFYSGRHFWKTLMSAEGLGENIEEIWMGHKVSGDVKKLYDHKDKFGLERSKKKAVEMFEILDRCIFAQKSREEL